MKKHLFGFALFSLIVFTSALFYAFFYTPKFPRVGELKLPVFESEKKISCPVRRINEMRLAQITQATIDKGSRIFSASIKGNNNLELTTKIKLHFFVADGANMRFVATENSKPGAIGYDQGAGIKTTSINLFSCEWLKKFNPKNNFYVIIEALNEDSDLNAAPPEFDANTAVPVLWIHAEDTDKSR